MDKLLANILTPLAELCMRRGVRVQTVMDHVKSAFIRAAETELNAKGERTSISRLSAMTGLQRKDIKQITSSAPTPLATDVIAKIVGQWAMDKRFLDRTGRPRTLTLNGDHNEFATLVTAVSSDLSPYTALFELERLGLAVRSETGVTLLAPCVEVRGDQEVGLQLLGEDVQHLMAAVSQNIFNRDPVPNLHARTTFDNIAPSAIPKIRSWLLAHGTAFHAELRAFLSRFDRDLNPAIDPSAQRVSITVGSFSTISEPATKAQKNGVE